MRFGVVRKAREPLIRDLGGGERGPAEKGVGWELLSAAAGWPLAWVELGSCHRWLGWPRASPFTSPCRRSQAGRGAVRETFLLSTNREMQPQTTLVAQMPGVGAGISLPPGRGESAQLPSLDQAPRPLKSGRGLCTKVLTRDPSPFPPLHTLLGGQYGRAGFFSISFGMVEDLPGSPHPPQLPPLLPPYNHLPPVGKDARSHVQPRTP